MLLPRSLKESARRRAEEFGISLGEYVRNLIETDLLKGPSSNAGLHFPFGDAPVHSGRTRGSESHDRPA